MSVPVNRIARIASLVDAASRNSWVIRPRWQPHPHGGYVAPLTKPILEMLTATKRKEPRNRFVFPLEELAAKLGLDGRLGIEYLRDGKTREGRPVLVFDPRGTPKPPATIDLTPEYNGDVNNRSIDYRPNEMIPEDFHA